MDVASVGGGRVATCWRRLAGVAWAFPLVGLLACVAVRAGVGPPGAPGSSRLERGAGSYVRAGGSHRISTVETTDGVYVVDLPMSGREGEPCEVWADGSGGRSLRVGGRSTTIYGWMMAP